MWLMIVLKDRMGKYGETWNFIRVIKDWKSAGRVGRGCFKNYTNAIK